MIKKALHMLIYKNKFFIPLVALICVFIGFFTFSLINKIDARNRLKNLDIYPIPLEFDVPLDVMEQTLKGVVDNKDVNEVSFVNLLSLLAFKYSGDWSRYQKNDIDALIDEFKNGKTEKDLIESNNNYKDFKQQDIVESSSDNYKNFKQFYESIFKETVGYYAISKKSDENNKPIFHNKFGIKNYFPIAYDFESTFLDDYEKEDRRISSMYHSGIDINAKLRTPIVAVESGIVKECGKTSDFGWQVVIESLDGLRNFYYSNCYSAHPFTTGIKPKTLVKAGQVIGYVGATSCCSQKVVRPQNCPHLHFGMSLNLKRGSKKYQVWLNPYKYLQLLKKHQSVVVHHNKAADFENKYIFYDPSFEAYLKKYNIKKFR